MCQRPNLTPNLCSVRRLWPVDPNHFENRKIIQAPAISTCSWISGTASTVLLRICSKASRLAGELINLVLIDVHHFSQRIHGYRDGLSPLTDMGHRGFSLGDGLNAVIILSFHLSQLLLVVFLPGDQFKNS